MAGTVYIVGAGVSRAAGLPLMEGFFEQAERYLRPGSGWGSQHIAGRNEWDALRDVLDYADRKLDCFKSKGWSPRNLEHVFSVLHDEIATSSPNVRTGQDLHLLRRYLRFATIRTLEIAEFNGRGALASDPFEDRAKMGTPYAVCASALGEEDTVISFNYDLLLERGLVSLGIRPEYALSADPVRNIGESWSTDWPSRKLLKVHGSANWMMCDHSDCEGVHVHTDVFNNTAAHVNDEDCHACGRKARLDFLIVPPTTCKVTRNGKSDGVRQNALQSLREAARVIVIGYSCPDTDKEEGTFGSLMEQGLTQNPAIVPVVVVNPNPEHAKRVVECVAERTQQRIIPRNFPEGGNCGEQARFEQFMQSSEGRSLIGLRG